MTSASKEKTASFAVTNQTDQRICVEGSGLSFELAPFERRELEKDVVACLDAKALRASADLDVEEIPPIAFESFGGVFGVCFAVYFVAAGLLEQPLGSQWAWIAALAVPLILLSGAAVYILTQRDAKAVRRSFVSAIDWLRQKISLLIVLVIGAGVPAAAIYYAADVRGTIDAIFSPPPGADLHPEVYTLVGRLLQFAFISAVSLLPALLYFLFDREQLQTIREQFVRQMFRLDGTIGRRRDVQAKYGLLMDEAFGRQRSGRLLPGRRSPLFIATGVLTLGWLLTLLNADVGRIGDEPRELVSLFTPRQSALTFGFLGAYFFALNTVVRGYVRKDLRPKSYSTITVRILTVAILAWVLEVPLRNDAPYLLVFVFLAGIVPETAVVYVQELVRQGSFIPGASADLVERHPLTNLEGIDLYDRTRLSDEGVTNVEALAHHDLIELMLYTRIPPVRLVDWVDQAILYLHVGDLPTNGESDGDGRRQGLAILGAHGIRTATDLERAWTASKISRKRSRALLNLLPPPQTGERRLPRLRVVLDVIADEEWMEALRHWHGPVDANADPIPPVKAPATTTVSDDQSEPATNEEQPEQQEQQQEERELAGAS